MWVDGKRVGEALSGVEIQSHSPLKNELFPFSSLHLVCL